MFYRPLTLNDIGRISVETTETTIDNLSDGTRYTVTVSAENDKTDGMETEIIQNTSTLLLLRV